MEPKISFDFETTHLIIQKISFIDSFKGEWNVIIESKNPKIEELTRKALILGSAAAARLDGPAISDMDAQRLFNSPGAMRIPTPNQGKVLGFYDAISKVVENYKQIPLTEDTLFSLHKSILQYSDKDGSLSGKYKTSANKDVSDEPKFEHQLFYNTTVRFIVNKETNELLSWMSSELESKKIHPLILTAWFIYEFLSINPFQDANGRMAKVLTTLLLLKDKYHFIRYMPLEKIMEDRQADYFEVLLEGQRHRRRYTEREKISDWIIFFMECMELSIKKLEAVHTKIAAEIKALEPPTPAVAPIIQRGVVQAPPPNPTPIPKTPARKRRSTAKLKRTLKKQNIYLNDRQILVLEYIIIYGPVKISDVDKEFFHISRNTIKKDLSRLQSQGLILQVGRGRGTYYRDNKAEEVKPPENTAPNNTEQDHT